MPQLVSFHEIARLPMPGDNVAIATREVNAGTKVAYEGKRFTIDHTILEGHRFTVQPIRSGENLLSWGLPFGIALRDIAPGQYVCNGSMLEDLRARGVDIQLPTEPNFKDATAAIDLNRSNFRPAEQVSSHDHSRTFMGFRRERPRGVGTRNYIVLLGTTSRSSSFVKQLEAQLKDLAASYENISGIVAVAHTEGDGSAQPNNLELLLRTLSGFVVHPNVGAVLAVDHKSSPITNRTLRQYMEENGYPLNSVRHHFLSLTGTLRDNLAQGESIVRQWLEPVNQTPRIEESVAALRIALQCGGSDAFSGVSGNPLAAWVAKEIIRHGGAANLAETDELFGAETYMLQKVKDFDTAREFLDTIQQFKEWMSWHGTTTQGNLSGGNKFRGLYNTPLKSIGAAMKRAPDVRLDYVIDYSERMEQGGFYFMNSPGNDLESVAGQVAAGCNAIFFVTGNGSITNFPFVPTIKIVTTTRRYRLLSEEMDVNAGAYLDGTSMPTLGKKMLELTIDVASGTRTKGEAAGHAQTHIWRDWQQQEDSRLDQLPSLTELSGSNLQIKPEPDTRHDVPLSLFRTDSGYTSDRVGLILPTSLCAGEIARMSARRLNENLLGNGRAVTRFVALAHTEGCAVSRGPTEELYVRTLLGYLTHPMVNHCLLLEHGCERTNNSFMRNQIVRAGLDPQEFGWASVQMDGGVENVLHKVETWFTELIPASREAEREMVGLKALRLALITDGPIVPAATASGMAQLTRMVAAAGGTVVIPENTSLLAVEQYRKGTLDNLPVEASLSYGQQPSKAGFHIMAMPTEHWGETLTGLGAAGVELILAHISDYPLQTHPMIPVLQFTSDPRVWEMYEEDLDLFLDGRREDWLPYLLQKIAGTISHAYSPKLFGEGYATFQISRGPLGITL